MDLEKKAFLQSPDKVGKHLVPSLVEVAEVG